MSDYYPPAPLAGGAGTDQVARDAAAAAQATATAAVSTGAELAALLQGDPAAAASLDYLGRISAKDPRYGAVGDGVADDSAAIERLRDAVVAVNGEAYFPPGVYRITREIAWSAGVTLRGAKPGRNTAAQKGSVILLDSATAGVAAFAITGTVLGPQFHANIANLGFQAAAAVADQSALRFTSISVGFLKIDHVRIDSFGGYGIYFNRITVDQYAQNVNLTDVAFVGCGGMIGWDAVDADQLICTLLVMTNVSSDGTVPAVSPKSPQLDLRGFREIVAANLLCEGAGGTASAWDVCWIAGNLWTRVLGWHIEYSTNKPTNGLVIKPGGYLIAGAKYIAATIEDWQSPYKLVIQDKNALVTVRRWNPWVGTAPATLAAILDTSAMAATDHFYCDLEVCNQVNLPLPDALIGRVKLRTIGYNNNVIMPFTPGDRPGYLYRGGQITSADNTVLTKSSGGGVKYSGIRTDATMGRVWEEVGLNFCPQPRFLMAIPAIGVTYYMAALYCFLHGDTGPTYQALYSDTGATYNSQGGFGQNVAAASVADGSWAWGGTVAQALATSAGAVFRHTGTTPTGIVRVRIAAFAAGLGNELPARFEGAPAATTPLQWAATSPPTYGDYVKGDRVTNSAAAVGSPKAWLCSTAGAACATAWAASTAYVLGDQRSNGGNVYEVTTAGTSAASGGPTGTGTGIADGTAVWAYVGPLAVFTSEGNL